MTPFHAQKDRALAALAERGLSNGHAAPPLFRLLWKCGIEVKPPHFLSPSTVAVCFGGWYGLGWGTFMWIFVWSRQQLPLAIAIAIAIGAGTFFGVAMAGVAAYQRKKYTVPAWEAFAHA